NTLYDFSNRGIVDPTISVRRKASTKRWRSSAGLGPSQKSVPDFIAIRNQWHAPDQSTHDILAGRYEMPADIGLDSPLEESYPTVMSLSKSETNSESCEERRPSGAAEFHKDDPQDSAQNNEAWQPVYDAYGFTTENN